MSLPRVLPAMLVVSPAPGDKLVCRWLTEVRKVKGAWEWLVTTDTAPASQPPTLLCSVWFAGFWGPPLVEGCPSPCKFPLCESIGLRSAITVPRSSDRPRENEANPGFHSRGRLKTGNLSVLDTGVVWNTSLSSRHGHSLSR
jgi:hypothetical protein